MFLWWYYSFFPIKGCQQFSFGIPALQFVWCRVNMRSDSLTGWILANVPESRKLELYKLFQVWRESKPIATDNWRECGSGLSPFVVGCGNQRLWWRANFMTFYHFNQTSLSSFNKHYWEGEAGHKLTPWPLHYIHMLFWSTSKVNKFSQRTAHTLTLKQLKVPWIPHNILLAVCWHLCSEAVCVACGWIFW